MNYFFESLLIFLLAFAFPTPLETASQLVLSKIRELQVLVNDFNVQFADKKFEKNQDALKDHKGIPIDIYEVFNSDTQELMEDLLNLEIIFEYVQKSGEDGLLMEKLEILKKYYLKNEQMMLLKGIAGKQLEDKKVLVNFREKLNDGIFDILKKEIRISSYHVYEEDRIVIDHYALSVGPYEYFRKHYGSERAEYHYMTERNVVLVPEGSRGKLNGEFQTQSYIETVPFKRPIYTILSADELNYIALTMEHRYEWNSKNFKSMKNDCTDFSLDFVKRIAANDPPREDEIPEKMKVQRDLRMKLTDEEQDQLWDRARTKQKDQKNKENQEKLLKQKQSAFFQSRL